MKVCRAETGETFEVDVAPETPVNLLKEALASPMQVAAADVILICSGVSLEAGHPLEHYRLPSASKEVFMFSRKSVEDSIYIPRVDEAAELKVPSLPVKQDPPDRGELGPIMRALYYFQDQFEYHLSYGQTLDRTVAMRVSTIERLVVAQTVQARGLEAAVANLNTFDKLIGTAWTTFCKQYQEQSAMQRELLEGFAGNVEKLRTIPLHPVFCPQGEARTLADSVPQDRLYSWAQECSTAYESLKAKVDAISGEIKAAQEDVVKENQRKPNVDFDRFQQLIAAARHSRDDSRMKTETLGRDFQRAQTEVAREGEPNPLGATGQLELLEQQHDETILPALRDAAQSTQANLVTVSQSKMEMTACVYERLRGVSKLQSKIRGLVNKIGLYKELLSSQNTPFQQLRYLQQLPEAYRAWEREVSRRRRFATVYAQRSQDLVETLASMRDTEATTRDAFFQTYGRCLPRQLVPGISEQPAYVDIQTPAPDSLLPAIDLPEEQEADQPAQLVVSVAKSDGDEQGIVIPTAPAVKDSIDTLDSGAGATRSPLSASSESFDIDMERILHQKSEFEMELARVAKEKAVLEQQKNEFEQELARVAKEKATLEEDLRQAREAFSDAQDNNAHLETQLHAVVSALDEGVKLMQPTQVADRIRVLNDECRRLRDTTIVWENFGAGDRCLFVLNERGHYAVFGQRKRVQMFLKPDGSQVAELMKCRPAPRFIVGNIIEDIRPIRATETVDGNPYNVPVGSDYFEVVAADLETRP
eukprot:TRINITY_DN2211_c0_g1_i1.p1 TRINITY_DN2211_c0_g1~~TRINITY_DN2211_c0_g1_i1.p1  ORF type:complete len:769 (+),score=168.56 TRINITY_DN2211_c0_g1_i1:29-2308(+)